MNKEIILLLEQGYSLLTPTMRLSRYLNNEYAALQLDSGKSVWESPDIIPWHAWLHRFWDDYSVYDDIALLRLTAWQQQSVWLNIVKNSDYSRDILQPQSVARRAIQAWDLTHQWQLPLYPKDIFISHDVRAFQSWAHSFEKICETENWIDEVRLADILTQRLTHKPLQQKQKVALLGFENIHPQQRSFLHVLSESGSEVKLLPFENNNRTLQVSSFEDTEDEVNAVANWAKQLLESKRCGKVGVVVPNLEKLRTKISSNFDDVLMAEDILSASELSSRPYSISLGQGLNSFSIIAAAFSILALVEQPLAIKELGVLLRSPFLQDAGDEKSKRAALDALLRENGETYLSISTLIYINSLLPVHSRCDSFIQQIIKWQETFEQFPAKQSAREWAQSFSQLLTLFNWPGDRALNSTEYQTIQAWQDLLMRFISLDIVNTRQSYRSALAQLRQLASAFSFQPETEEVPVQVMGTAGAAAMQFEHLWIMGLHEDIWPGPLEPNPFIPLALQREHKLPFGSSESHLHHARQLTDNLIKSATEIVVSYPQNEKERQLRPSPLLKEYIEKSTDFQVGRAISFQKIIFESASFDYELDDVAPEIETGQRVRGGTGLFKDQAACAFRAFARHRIRARTLKNADIGLDAMERGSLLHDVMQQFWTKVSGHSALMNLSEAEAKLSIEESIDAVLTASHKQRPLTLTDRFMSIEKRRLIALVEEWLELEKKRQSFEVKACELKHNFEFANIELHTRIDRIDKLEDGREIIIDYKTGKASANDWFDDRPNEPQLPLYAITSKAELAAIVFAIVKRGESSFVGLADGDNLFPAVKNIMQTKHVDNFENWQGVLKKWEKVMTQLADDFRRGKADVEPKNVNTCRYCDLHAFCRIYEKADSELGFDSMSGHHDD